MRVSSLEFFLADGCNLRCAHCAASSPLLQGGLPDLEEFRGALRDLRGILSAGQIKFLGGEPLLNPRAAEFLAAAAASGLFDRVRLTTNGLLLERAADSLWEASDVVEVSCYPAAGDALSPAARRRLREKAARFEVSLELNDVAEFYPAVLDVRNEDESAVRRIFESCQELGNCTTLHRRSIYRCSRVHTLGRRHELPLAEQDALPLDPLPSLPERLRDYLAGSDPLRSCAYCLGTSGRRAPHSQLTADEVRSLNSGAPALRYSPSLVDLPGPLARLRRRLGF